MDNIVEKWCEIAQNLTTYLSEPVKELVLGKGIAPLSDFDPKTTINDLLDITNISALLLNDGISFNTMFFKSSSQLVFHS